MQTSFPITVRPELVEGLSFLCAEQRKWQGFDKLSPNGWGWAE
jgi:hypothetical protein